MYIIVPYLMIVVIMSAITFQSQHTLNFPSKSKDTVQDLSTTPVKPPKGHYNNTAFQSIYSAEITRVLADMDIVNPDSVNSSNVINIINSVCEMLCETMHRCVKNSLFHIKENEVKKVFGKLRIPSNCGILSSDLILLLTTTLPLTLILCLVMFKRNLVLQEPLVQSSRMQHLLYNKDIMLCWIQTSGITLYSRILM